MGDTSWKANEGCCDVCGWDTAEVEENGQILCSYCYGETTEEDADV